MPLRCRIVVAGRRCSPPRNAHLPCISGRGPQPDGALCPTSIVYASGSAPGCALVFGTSHEYVVTVREDDIHIARTIDGNRREDIHQRGTWRSCVDQFHSEIQPAIGGACDVERVSICSKENGIDIAIDLIDFNVALIACLDPKYGSGYLRYLRPGDSAIKGFVHEDALRAIQVSTQLLGREIQDAVAKRCDPLAIHQWHV